MFYTVDLISIPDSPERNEDGTREIMKNTSRNALENDNKVSRSTFQDNTTHFENDITPLDFGIPNNIESEVSLSSKILPHGSINLADSKENPDNVKSRVCDFFEGSFIVDESKWNFIIKHEQLNKKYYPFVLRTLVTKHVNNVCCICINYTKFSKKKGAFIIFAKCKQNNYGCKFFKIEISLVNRIISVYSSMKDYIHPYYLTSHVKGIERTILKKKIYNETPSNLKKKLLLHSNKNNILISKNLQNLKSDCTLRKIKSEAMSELDRDKNDLLDLLLMQKSHPEYIKGVSHPFAVKIYSLEQFGVLKNTFLTDKSLAIHFDATGSVVRKPMKDIKRVFLYTAVIKTATTKRIFPAFSLITSNHDSNTIFKIFHDFRYFCEKNHFWPIFSKVVVDFSYASIHAICKAFDRCTFYEYLVVCSDYLCYGKNLPDNFITLHLCCAHFMKMVSKDVKETIEDENRENYFKDVMALGILIHKMQIFDEYVNCLVIILNSEFESTEVERAKETIASLSVSNFSCSLEEFKKNSYVCEEESRQSKSSPLYKASPFYLKYSSFLNRKEITDIAPVKKNVFCNEAFLKIFIEKYIPICPI